LVRLRRLVRPNPVCRSCLRALGEQPEALSLISEIVPIFRASSVSFIWFVLLTEYRSPVGQEALGWATRRRQRSKSALCTAAVSPRPRMRARDAEALSARKARMGSARRYRVQDVHLEADKGRGRGIPRHDQHRFRQGIIGPPFRETCYRIFAAVDRGRCHSSPTHGPP